MSVFGTVLLIACTLLQAYVLWRASSVPGISRGPFRRILAGVAFVLWACFVFGRMLEHASGGAVAATMELIGMNWLAVLFLTSACFLAVDLVTAFGLILRKAAPVLRAGALLAACILSAIAIVQGVRAPVIHNYEVRLRGLPQNQKETVIAVLSDLHLGTTTGAHWLEEQVTRTQDLKPDMIVLLGDLFEGHGAPAARWLPDLQRLEAPLGVWAVPGNHESYSRQNDSMRMLEAAGIRVLQNRWALVRPGLILAGVEDLTADLRAGRNRNPIAQALAGKPPGAVILLSHSPLKMDEAAAAGVGLMLSAHTHGGQIWPFGYLVELTYPLLEGKHDVRGMTVVISRGTGTWGPRMRLWHPGEILRIVVRS